MPFLAPMVTASAALVAAGAIAVAPVTPPTAQTKAVGTEVRLAAAATTDPCGATAVALCDPSGADAGAAVQGAPSLFNIPANLFIALANIPYNFFNALGQGDVNLGDLPNSGFGFINSRNGIDLNQTEVVGLTADLEYGGSWWVYHPFNVLGTDPADIARYQSLVNVLLPFPALSVGLGNIVAAVAASQLPMNVGCTGTNLGACDRPGQILSTMFDLRHVVALFSPGGYTFPQVKNPITCSADGLCDIKDANGVTEPWSQQNQALNIFTPFQNFYNSLTQTPDFSRIRIPSVTMIVNTIVNFIRGLNTAFNPFVRGTQCGLCALFVPIPAGETRPGSTNPGTLIPGKPGADSVTTELTATREAPTDEAGPSDVAASNTPEPVQGSAADAPRLHDAPQWTSAQARDAASNPEQPLPVDGDANGPAPHPVDVKRGHVDSGVSAEALDGAGTPGQDAEGHGRPAVEERDDAKDSNAKDGDTKGSDTKSSDTKSSDTEDRDTTGSDTKTGEGGNDHATKDAARRAEVHRDAA